jgi:hypothetical protein
MGEGTPQRRTEGGTGRCSVGGRGHNVKLREEVKKRVCLGKGFLEAQQKASAGALAIRKVKSILVCRTHAFRTLTYCWLR